MPIICRFSKIIILAMCYLLLSFAIHILNWILGMYRILYIK